MVGWFSFAARQREAPMRIQISVDGDGIERLKDLARYRVPDARRRMVELGMEKALESTVSLNPVDTGRSRAAWKSALDQLQGQANTAGPSSGPLAEGRSQGSLREEHAAETTGIAATNAVSYVPLLEYGTSRMTPFAMVRKSLMTIRSVIVTWFRLD
jgi:hypothetical protein